MCEPGMSSLDIRMAFVVMRVDASYVASGEVRLSVSGRVERRERPLLQHPGV